MEVLSAEFVDFLNLRETKLVAKRVSNVGFHSYENLIIQVIKVWHVGISSNDLNDYLSGSQVGVIASKLWSGGVAIKLNLTFLASVSCTPCSINFNLLRSVVPLRPF